MKPRSKASRKQPATAHRTADRPSTAAPPPRGWQAFAAGSALVVLVLVAYAPLATAGFVWDDDNYVLDNMALRSVNGLVHLVGSNDRTAVLPAGSQRFLDRVSPVGPAPVRLSPGECFVTCHQRGPGLAVARPAAGARRMAGRRDLRRASGRGRIGRLGDRAQKRAQLDAGIGSMLAYLRFAPAERAGDDAPATTRKWQRKWPWYLLSLFLFVLALLSKTVVASLPAVLLVIFWWRRGRMSPFDVLPLVPFFALGAGLGLVTVHLEKVNVHAVGPEWDFSAVDRLLIAGRALWFYVCKLAWPYPLIFFYTHWDIDSAAWWQYLFPVAAIAAIGALWWARGWWGAARWPPF